MTLSFKIPALTPCLRLPITSALLLSFSTAFSFAWGPTGHRVVAQIAEEHLSPQAKAAVESLIGPASLVDVANWADEVRADPSYNYASSWHYVNLPDGVAYEHARKHPDGDIYGKILELIKVLQNPDTPRAEKAEALKWLVHFTGDIHQPLHAGYQKDLGGNLVTCTWFGEPSNIHAIWDSKLIEATHLSYTELSASIERNAVVKVESGPAPKPERWLQESLQYRKVAYQIPGEGKSGTYRYIFEHTDLMKQRLRQAGLRLALTLDYVLAE
ncbi:S1/P1 nuclease [Coraliomargarita parva]|uniref:S1/P1 nuclease n=1 Tax=Coraliomargarita parva TaxID=3014050 RepID=UPI0022B30C32|nr:S1/P1 nuclease [Coraliomargarita parva]